jgi:hypothetical protein
MKRKYLISLAAAAIGSTALTAVHAQGFGHQWGHHHHGLGAAGACIATLTQAERQSELKPIFTNAKTGLKADFEKVRTDKQNIQMAILSGGTLNDQNLQTLEGTLSTDEATLQSAKDALASSICTAQGVNLTNAKNLYSGLLAQRKSNHEAVKNLFEAARP